MMKKKQSLVYSRDPRVKLFTIHAKDLYSSREVLNVSRLEKGRGSRLKEGV